MKLDEQILRELETEQTALPAHIGSIDSVIARGKRRKVLSNAAGALAGVAVISLVVGVTAWLGGRGGEPEPPAVQTPDSWTTYTAAEGLTGDCACDMAVAADGTLWAAGAEGAFRFDGSSWTLEPFPPGFAFADGSVAGAPDGSMWFAGGDPYGVARYDSGSWTVIEPYDVEMWGGFNDIAIAGDGTVWAIEGAFVTRLVGEVFELVNEDFQPMPEHQLISGDRAIANASILMGPDGTLWVTGETEAGGPRIYNYVGSEVSVVADIGLPGAFTLIELLGVAPDGALWLSAEAFGQSDDDSKLLRFDGQLWSSYPVGGVKGAVFTPDGNAWFVVAEVTGDEKLWRRQYSEPGAYRFDGESWAFISVEDGLAGSDLASVAATSDGSIWFGMASNGVTRYQPGTNPAVGTPIEIISNDDPFSEGNWPPPIDITEPPPVTLAPPTTPAP